jgi:hypothetical protein
MAENTNGDKLIAAACAAFGIDKKFVFASNYDEKTKTATVLTNGGSRVRFQDGDKAEPLRQIQVTGINPAKRKVIAGKEKK